MSQAASAVAKDVEEMAELLCYFGEYQPFC